MIIFFQTETTVYVVETYKEFSEKEQLKLSWLFSDAFLVGGCLEGIFIGPRHEMISPWSTNAVEITQNMGLESIRRIELFKKIIPPPNTDAEKYAKTIYDPMLEEVYKNPGQEVFLQERNPEPVRYIDDLRAYTQEEGLALNEDEIHYLEDLSEKLNRKLTDSEVFGFSQVNSEHCRHKIFNGTFVIDGEVKPFSLFELIKKTSKENPNKLISAYKDNVAFIEGPKVEQFSPGRQDKPDFFHTKEIDTVISLKAETHNFPTTVEPFNGAATGSGGEIRDRMAGGTGSIPMAGTAVYMTSYSRLSENSDDKTWEKNIIPRKWLYQSPDEILIKASNGASDFGNKFGQPLICGSLFTFEHEENNKKYGFDKVIMLAGGIGYGNRKYALKQEPAIGDKVIVLGGDNYRIGMGGGAVSSVATGEFSKTIELNAVQRSNPEMQKRVFNAIRALVEMDNNPIVSIHDHGAGGHLNCLSELLETVGGKIDIDKLPIGDKTLSAKEIIGNESQERMGLLLRKGDIELLQNIAEREHAPVYVVGETTGDNSLVFTQEKEKISPVHLDISDMFGNPPKTLMEDHSIIETFKTIDENSFADLNKEIEAVLRMEAVACKDWLTNKVDRSVTGKIAKQQCCGSLQLPLNNLGVVALDFKGKKGIATAIGHAPAIALINPAYGSVMAIAEALTNIVWASLNGGLNAVSLSANWMWPSKNKGEDARLYQAVEAASDFACQLGINIPTGKDSLSMTQKYPNGDVVFSPGTVIISAVGEVEDIKKTVSPVLQLKEGSKILYLNLSSDTFKLGGSAYAQTKNHLGDNSPTVADANYFKQIFNLIQQLIREEKILAGHDISAGGMITALFEMTFADNRLGLDVDLSAIEEEDLRKILFAENAGILLQVENNGEVEDFLKNASVQYTEIAKLNIQGHHQTMTLKKNTFSITFDIDHFRDVWYETSYLFDCKQSGKEKATERYDNYKNQELIYTFSKDFTGRLEQYGLCYDRKPSGIKAAIIREKGTNGDREMAYSLYLAGFDVKDVHVSDLMNGRETLEDIRMIVFPGGFSHSDVLGSAKGWAGAFLFNENARKVLHDFYARKDTLSLGVCNGCQLMMELGLIYPQHSQRPKMLHNASHKFESNFVNVNIMPNHSVMLSALAGSRLGIWVAHGEGKFHLPYEESRYHIPVKYSYSGYPGNPNGSAYQAAALCSEDGRHLAIMPHLERSLFSWHWAYYPTERKSDEVSPWIEAFVNARKWIEERR
ncbi:MAG: phosphoribosylformylglycinamidine synthase [Bacteroidales bacterium]|jgi:phosphoribosylformylglycinamidine synthase|nr:phosphoribosylformylglycinamidine synthase [Bacteroidales bacterium]